MAKPKVDPIAWAKAQPRAVGGRKCSTCSDPRIVAVIRKWVPMWKSGEITISVRQARDFLADQFGYTYTTGAFKHCLAEHHGATFRG
jgi:hypothetical protein